MTMTSSITPRVAARQLLPERYSPAEWPRLPIGTSLDNKPIALRLDRVPHTAVVGSAGAGRTAVIQQIILAAAARGHTVVVVDEDRSSWAPFAHYLAQVMWSPELAIVAARGMLIENELRLLGLRPLTPRFIVFSSFEALVAEAARLGELTQLQAFLRSAHVQRIHVVGGCERVPDEIAQVSARFATLRLRHPWRYADPRDPGIAALSTPTAPSQVLRVSHATPKEIEIALRQIGAPLR